VLTRGTSTQAFLTLRDGSAQQANYDLTGEGAQTAELIYVHSDHLSTPRLATNDTQTVLWRWAGEAFGNTAPNEDPDGDGVKTTFNLRFPGQYYDGESGLFYGGARYWDPRLGKAITADRRSVGKHVELMLDRMNAPKLLRSVGVTMTPDANAPPLELNPYTYVANNPLRWTDPTGEGIVVPIVIIGGACFTMYCTIQAKNYCQAAYSSTGNPDTDRKRVKCFSERVKFCATFGAYIMDPIGSGAATVGEEVGRRTCDECKQ